MEKESSILRTKSNSVPEDVQRQKIRTWQSQSSAREMANWIELKKDGQFDQNLYDVFEKKDYLIAIKKYAGEGLDFFKKAIFVDIGAGPGSRVHEVISELGAKIINLDMSPASIKYLKKTAKEPGVIGDAYALPLADNSIDGAISSNFINLTNRTPRLSETEKLNIEDFFKEVRRVLKPNGLFIQSNFGGSFDLNKIALKLLGSLGFTEIDQIKPLSNPAKSAGIEYNNQMAYGWASPMAFIAKNNK